MGAHRLEESDPVLPGQRADCLGQRREVRGPLAMIVATPCGIAVTSSRRTLMLGNAAIAASPPG